MFVFPRTVFFITASYPRRLPNFISNKIRTFATSKTVHNLKRIHESKASNNQICRLLEINKNIRMLFISDTECKSHCFSVRVGVGGKDDKTGRAGMSHLLEHVIVKQLSSGVKFISGRTCPEMTMYYYEVQDSSFGRSSNLLFEQLHSLSLLMFSNMPIVETNIEFERKRVDAEFHEKRKQLDRRMRQIFYLKKVTEFRDIGGNSETLEGSDYDLKNELEKRRSLYRERPVFVCIYSSLPINHIEKSFVKNFWIYKNGSEYQKLTEQNSTKREEEEKPTTKGQPTRRLFVVQSDSDSLQLEIFFPFNIRLNVKQQNSLLSIAELLDSYKFINLQDVFLQKKIGTRCYGPDDGIGEFFSLKVVVDLFDCKKDDFQRATAGIFQFIELVRDSCGQPYLVGNRTDRLIPQKPIEYVQYITRHCNEIKNEFIETDLFTTVSDNELRHLITTDILENEDAVYSIVTRNTEEVIKNLCLSPSPSPKIETEPLFQTRYKFCHTDFMFHKPNYPVFDENDKKRFYGIGRRNFTTTKINDSSDLAYKHLCVANLMIQNTEFRKSFKLLFPNDKAFYTEQGDLYVTLQTFLDQDNVQEILHGLDAFRMDDAQFRLAKQYKMRILSDLLTDSAELARSLLAIAVQNFHCPVKIDPITQYDNLRKIEKEHYNHHFKKESIELEKEDRKRTTEELIIPAINRNELYTVTLNLFQVNGTIEKQNLEAFSKDVNKIARNVRNKYGLYTLKCIPLYGASSISFETFSVEKVCGMETVREHIIVDLIKSIDELANSQNKYSKMWESMKANKWCIQIHGHKSSEVLMDKTFEEQFAQWFTQEKTKFDTFFQRPPQAA